MATIPTHKENDFGRGFEVILRNVFYKPSRYAEDSVLKNINLEVKAGEFVAIVGSNAAGKSSILKAIAGELRGVQGQVLVASQIIKKPINQILDRVGIVHQFDDADLIQHLSVAQNVAIRQLLGGGHKNKLFSTGERWHREIATELGTRAHFASSDLDLLVRNLAGGKRQMLSVAIAIHLEHIWNPCRLLLLDEHTSRLDPQNAEEIIKYTAAEIRRIKTTAVMVTHRYSDALKYPDRILVVYRGSIFKDEKRSKSITPKMLEAWTQGKES